MNCPKCTSRFFFHTIWFKYCYSCEQWKLEKTRRKQERKRLKFNTHKE